MKTTMTRLAHSERPRHVLRRGIIIPLAAFLLLVILAFIALAVDTGKLILVRTELQNAADAGSLAAAEEMVRVLNETAETQAPLDPATTVARARQVGVDVVTANGAYADGSRDIIFGHRIYSETDNRHTVTWNQQPYNAVKITGSTNQRQPCGERQRSPAIIWLGGGKTNQFHHRGSDRVRAGTGYGSYHGPLGFDAL